MISCPFEYSLTDDELRLLGEMLMTWSHTEHTIGNCLKATLKFSDDEAIALIFPLNFDARVRWLCGLKDRLSPYAKTALAEFQRLSPALLAVRTLGVHGIIINDVKEGPLMHLRSKDRTFTKADFFQCEEFINYCARIAHEIRTGVDLTKADTSPVTLPERPAIPKALEPFIQRKKLPPTSPV